MSHASHAIAAVFLVRQLTRAHNNCTEQDEPQRPIPGGRLAYWAITQEKFWPPCGAYVEAN